MLSDAEIELIRPVPGLAKEVQDALIESYELHRTFLPWATPNPDLQEILKNLEIAATNFDTHEGEYRYFIKRLKDARILGCIGLHIRDLSVPHFEFGYWIRESEQNKGYISRALHLLESHAVNELGAKLLELHTAGTNEASRRVAERAGFQLREVMLADRTLPSGEQDSTYIYFKTYS